MTEDVVIAGAGPNGLMLACELSLAGVRPIVLERLPGRTRENRANGLVGQVVRALDRRGLYGRLSGSAEPPQPSPAFVFGAMPLDLSRLDDNPMYGLPVPQLRIEQVLEERALELGVEIRRGQELTGLSQDADGVTVEISGPEGGYRLRTRYLVGADGGHSVTRKLCGIGFPGVTKDDSTSRGGHVTVPAELIDPVTGGLNVPGYGPIPPFMHHRTDHGLFVYAPFPTGTLVHTTEWHQDGDDEPMSLDELRRSIRRVLGVDLPIGPHDGEGPHQLRRRTGGNTRLAERFRDGRVVLVGDAAHVHSAIGGPGLNLGLQDAINLGWKLAAEIHGWAPPGLLDTYETERRPAAERVVMHTQAQSALIAPGPEVTALRTLFGELLRDERTVKHIADMMSGADIGYDLEGTHPLTGRPAPDLVLETETGSVRLAELTRTARPLLIDLTPDAALAGALRGWHDRVDLVTAPRCVPTALRCVPTALLLRPDCYVAWASDSPSPDGKERDTLRTALASTFGAAR
ncbi:FAD-dependent monooxygenase [Microbispora sp. NPDC088329]|uniref:FAD-dependent monooxygenase n=1 Tax=Microbispora sp. NPDC088329 TaxID=3154869 RepID=UPI0034394E3D